MTTERKSTQSEVLGLLVNMPYNIWPQIAVYRSISNRRGCPRWICWWYMSAAKKSLSELGPWEILGELHDCDDILVQTNDCIIYINLGRNPSQTKLPIHVTTTQDGSFTRRAESSKTLLHSSLNRSPTTYSWHNNYWHSRPWTKKWQRIILRVVRARDVLGYRLQ
jgi:hypothetical protein